MPVARGNPLLTALHEAGLLPEHCYGIEISDDANIPVTTISYKCYLTSEVSRILVDTELKEGES
jgi:hypothetical protein